jgi:acyl-CoA thioesterase-1
MPRQVATLAISLVIPAALLVSACRPADRNGTAAGPAQPAARALRGMPHVHPGRAAAAPRPVAAAAPAAATPAAPAPAPPPPPPGAAGTNPSLPPAQPAAGQLIVFLGDSLTAGLGLPADQAYPSLLARQLREDGLNVRVINAGVSGDTTAGGLRRLRWLLAQHPAAVVVGLGANDALRGQPVAEIEQNLRAIVTQARQGGVRVLLLGMQIPPNYGPDYTSAFAAVYPRIARDLHVPLVPFLLAGVGGISDLNQADGIHPTAAGQAKVAANVKPYLEDLLRRPAAGGAHAGVGPRGLAGRVTEPSSQAN